MVQYRKQALGTPENRTEEGTLNGWKHLGSIFAGIYQKKDYKPELLKDYFLKLSEEVGELSRAMRKGLRAADKGEISGTVDEEVWDVMYYAIAIANLYGVDLERVIQVKSEISQSKYPSAAVFEENR